MDLTELDGIGPVRAESLRAMGIFSLRDLLYTLPVRYEDRSVISPCAEKTAGNILVCGTIAEDPKFSVFHGLSKVTASIRDDSGRLSVCWYNLPWMRNHIHGGDRLYLYGRLIVKNNRRILQNPQILQGPEGIVPVYRAVKGFPAKSFRKLIESALEKTDDCCPETIPPEIRMKYQLCELNYAIRQAHFPSDFRSLEIARKRLSFERVLLYLLFAASEGIRKNPGFPFVLKKEQIEQYWSSLPYRPTKAQRRVLDEIASDLAKNVSMSRLVQGDVGCGKTAVAFGAVYLSCCAGYQASMMAPTEILARQHYENAVRSLAPLGVRCRLLTGSTKAKERRTILEELKNHECDAIFGTHALISKDVTYGKLGLVITDEQHRFGVNQRTALQTKGDADDRLPHVLVMSATPIPRTLALILYGDLDLSIIDELPAGRIPVKTRIVPGQKRQDMYGFLRKEIAAGKQAYIVCPLVEDSENQNELLSAKSLFSDLRSGDLKGLRLGLTWGSQKADEKNQLLRDFAEGKYDVLVSTTVIEVGINNPNASIMIIENAENFGLSQLHQLRGRVGRGDAESWCFLLAEPTDKLNVLCATNDGFVLSQKDLELRGPGDLIGTRQSGMGDFSAFLGNSRILDEASRCVQELLRNPALKDTRDTLEKQAQAYFRQQGRIALN